MSDFNQSKNVKDWHKAGMEPGFFIKKKKEQHNNNNKKAKQ